MDKPLHSKQQFWKEHIEQARSEKMSLAGYAKLHNLDLKALYNNKSALVKKGILSDPSKAFIKVQAVPQRTAISALPVHVRLPNGVVLDIPDINPHVLALFMAL